MAQLTFTQWAAELRAIMAKAEQEVLRLECKAADMRRASWQEGLGALVHMNVDQANYALRQGLATKSNAEAYIAVWNRPGHRLTRAELKSRSIPFGDTGMVIHYIVLHEDP